jgi:AcrR family transcriptional regulator
VTVTAEDSRRRLTAKQVAVVERLVDAAADEARQLGYEATTVRGAAKRAGVAPATAYTYFASKDHLLAEVLWRRMDGLPEPASSAGPGLDCLTSELELLGLFMADDPVLAEACTSALLGSGPEVRAVRMRFGAEVRRRLERALGEGVDPSVLEGLELAYSGAMLWAGMGHLEFSEVPLVLGRLAGKLLDGNLRDRRP